MPVNAQQVPVITIRDVDKLYHTPAGDFQALKDINLNFYPGEFVAVSGKSGSGKSTLANMITGIDHPTRGSVVVGGVNIHSMREGKMSRWRGKNLGIVFQFFQLLPMLTVLENVMVPMDFCRMYRPDEREDRALELLKLVGLEDAADKMPGEISGGQQQSVAIARALANDPPIIIADEPTGNLDTRTASQVFALMQNLVADGKTIIMVTHDQNLARQTTRTVLLADGEQIYPALVSCFPQLSHRLLLELTHAVVEGQLPSESISLNAESRLGLYLGTAGSAQVQVRNASGTLAHQRTLAAGNCFYWCSDHQSAGFRASLLANGESGLSYGFIPAPLLAALVEKHKPLAAQLNEMAFPKEGLL